MATIHSETKLEFNYHENLHAFGLRSDSIRHYFGGGAGGAGNGIGGSGGSGIVIIAYPDTYNNLVSVSIGLTCNGSAGNTTPDTASRSGYKVYKFTAGTGTISW